MNHIEIQTIFSSTGQPSAAQIQRWVDAALEGERQDTEVVVRIVDEQEIAQLNCQYRQKNAPTNILSFPAEIPEGIDLDLLGDLVICAPVLEREALEQGKPLSNHWAHILIHGVLHLLSYDHINDDEADEMETKEISILSTLNIPNPYLEATQP